MFSFKSIKDYHTFLATTPDGCVQAVNHYLAAIEKNQHLNAFLEVFTAEALQRAAELDNERKQGAPMGRLHGVVVSLKDVICYKGHTITAASKILDQFESVYSATAVTTPCSLSSAMTECSLRLRRSANRSASRRTCSASASRTTRSWQKGLSS